MEEKTVARKYKSRMTTDKLDLKIEQQKEALEDMNEFFFG